VSTLTVKSQTGTEVGTVELDPRVFEIEPNVAVMHQVVTAQLAARRAGTHSTRSRAEVSGGGSKPWRQKGTGRARQGSIRAPHWRGGGIAIGPKPRDYRQKTPKKMVKLALRSALSDRAAEGRVVVIDEWQFQAPRTKDAVAVLSALGIDGRALVVVPPDDRATWLSFRNLPDVHVVAPSELNAYDVLCSDYVVFSRDTLPVATDGENRKERARRQIAAEAAELVREAKKAKARPRSEVKLGSDTPTAAAPASSAPSAASAAHTTSPQIEDPSGGDDDMADLPNRPKPNPDHVSRVVDPKDRVKSVADKEDPRFAAAREKAEKEQRLREKAQAKEAKDDAEKPIAQEAAQEQPKKKGSFSFNMTGNEETRG
jgi:large subunit ribosomal protein L4